MFHTQLLNYRNKSAKLKTIKYTLMLYQNLSLFVYFMMCQYSPLLVATIYFAIFEKLKRSNMQKNKMMIDNNRQPYLGGIHKVCMQIRGEGVWPKKSICFSDIILLLKRVQGEMNPIFGLFECLYFMDHPLLKVKIIFKEPI